MAGKKTEIVRRPDFAGGGVTQDELKRMAAHTQVWIARAMRTEPIDPDKLGAAIRDLYAAAKLPAPRVVIVPSPLAMAVTYGMAAAIWHLRNNENLAATDQATRQATAEATRQATAEATLQATYQATYQATRQATYQATERATRQATHQATAEATDEATAEATEINLIIRLGREFGGQNWRFFVQCVGNWNANSQGGNMWAYWDCYLTAARDILGLRLPSHEPYAAWEQAAIEGGFRCLHPEFCVVSDFPEILRVDDQRRPHCETGPSHRWRDGWSLYHWHGVRVPAEWIEDKASLTPAIALAEPNIEKRRAACEIVGWDRILRELQAKTIDRDPDPEIGELVEVNLPDAGRERFLRVRCGTGRRFAIPVPRAVRTALAANAWTFDIPPDLLKQKEFRT